ncbi:MAG: hypothetical protein SF187_21760 [Deltaproteobacteria bacterium]|nr:hypothetical protein [Deltaproteobacteria bacterium]
MAGEGRVRFCGACKHNVYDVSHLAADEVAALVFAHEGRLCVRMRARPDGTMVTKDCRARLRALRAKGVLGWMLFLLLIVPVTLGSHLLQLSWLWQSTCHTGAPRVQGEVEVAPAAVSPFPDIVMGKPMLRER